MLRIFSTSGAQLAFDKGRLPDTAVWIDLCDPTAAEETLLEALLGIDLPTADDMAEIETSSRLYTDNGVIVMTATLAIGLIAEQPETCPVSFLLSRNHLVTIRYHEVRSFDRFALQIERSPELCATPRAVLMGLIDTIVDRLADGFEYIGREVDAIARAAFRRAVPEARGRQQRRTNQALQVLMTRLGSAQDALSKARETAVSLTRTLTYLQFTIGKDAGLTAQIKMQLRDLNSFADQASYIGGNLTFLLDATLGLISIEQNAVLRIVSVASLVFLPPTLVAGVYGMNFRMMPELGWDIGYPFALVMMLLAAVLPYGFFRWRGWL
ncbi:magnesium transporter CorA family protein [Sandarakinorhabdus sp.]|uniref:magnesium transporter CorA family protein n=1 Tax=Sandarakinorhabdus sp. TaxID=1916663 RepID=UPI003F6F3FB1